MITENTTAEKKSEEKMTTENAAGSAGGSRTFAGDAEETRRQRVKQLRKRSVPDRSFEAVRADRRSPEPIGYKRRGIPKAESREDAILAGIALALGFLAVVCVFVFFAGVWPPSGYVVILCFAGIFIIAGIDSLQRNRLKALFFFAGTAALLAGTVFLLLW